MPVRSNSADSSFNPTQLPVYDAPYNPSPKYRTVERYLNAFHAMDYEGCMSVFDDTLEHRIIPQSLGRPVLNKRQYGEYFRGIMPRYKWLRFTLHEVIETEDKMTIHGTVKGESVRGTPYNNEYILMLHFSPLVPGETEQKICFVKEFVDSDSITKFYAEDSARARANGERSNSNSNGSIQSVEAPRGRERLAVDVPSGRGRESTSRKSERVEGRYVPTWS